MHTIIMVDRDKHIMGFAVHLSEGGLKAHAKTEDPLVHLLVYARPVLPTKIKGIRGERGTCMRK